MFLLWGELYFLSLSPAPSPPRHLVQRITHPTNGVINNSIDYLPRSIHTCTHREREREVEFPLFTAGKLDAKYLTSLTQIGECLHLHLKVGVFALYSRAIYIKWHWAVPERTAALG